MASTYQFKVKKVDLLHFIGFELNIQKETEVLCQLKPQCNVTDIN
jgi:hypothetical protein